MKSQRERFSCLVVVSAALLLSLFEAAMAQSPHPPLSPWLDMFRENRSGSGLSNYHTFVAPRLQLQRELSQQERQLQQQQAQQRDMQGQLDQALNSPKKRPSYSPASGAGYRQYLQYYKGLPQGGPPYHGRR